VNPFPRGTLGGSSKVAPQPKGGVALFGSGSAGLGTHHRDTENIKLPGAKRTSSVAVFSVALW
jgi:hypothetical protein